MGYLKLVCIILIGGLVGGRVGGTVAPASDPATPRPPPVTIPTTTETLTTQDPLEARYILCQVMCQEKYAACFSDTTNVHYRMSLALNVQNPENAKRQRAQVCGQRKAGCREKCHWLKEQTHMYDRNCTATNFLVGLDFNKPGFSLKKALKTLTYITP
ncbi:uncharacterized protein LOC135502906 [Lineus longissimus]|uniref:uncharacterized protein LOC135502906 n=1 Tax=Lineus longissimus TaxID=88925 RepID=UPI002B4F4BA8